MNTALIILITFVIPLILVLMYILRTKYIVFKRNKKYALKHQRFDHPKCK